MFCSVASGYEVRRLKFGSAFRSVRYPLARPGFVGPAFLFLRALARNGWLNWPMKYKVIAFIFAVLGLGPCVLKAQEQAKNARVGFFIFSQDPSVDAPNPKAFRQKLNELGWVEGKNLVIEWRFARGMEERVPELLADFIRLKVDVMVLPSGPPLRLAKEATTKIPIVMTGANNPVAEGLIASLARPGGNITGVASTRRGLVGKRLEILKDIFPKLFHVTVFWHSIRSAESAVGIEIRQAELKAKDLGIKLRSLGVERADDFQEAFRSLSAGQSTGLLVVHSQLMHGHRQLLGRLAAKARVPAIYQNRLYTEAGGLMSYGPNSPENYALAASYVDKILRGANPAELPVEQPTKLELVINLQAARRIGLTIPDKILRWADEVIE